MMVNKKVILSFFICYFSFVKLSTGHGIISFKVFMPKLLRNVYDLGAKVKNR